MQQDISQTRRASLANEYEYEDDQSTEWRFRVIDIADGTFHSGIDINENHLQQDGFITPGVMTVMADKTAGYACCTTVEDRFMISTIEFRISFLTPASGDALECFSRVVGYDGETIMAESEIFDIQSDEKIRVANAVSIMKVVPRPLSAEMNKETV